MEMFSGLALVVGLAAGLGVVARMLRQPPLLGYVAAGVVMAVGGKWVNLQTGEMLDLMGRLGVTLLLFLVGLELPVSELKKMGRVALATGIGQIVFTTAVGYGLIRILGFESTAAWFLAIALAFSSTIIVVKLLSEKKDLQSLYGRIAVGFLLVQDFVAVGLLMILAGWAGGVGGWGQVGSAMARGAVLVAFTMWLAAKVTPSIAGKLAKTPELLFVGSVAWCLGVAAAVASPVVGFGVEIGGFLAGLALSGAAEHMQVAARVRPLRDFFLMMFFVWLGSGMGAGSWAGIWWPALILSAFVLIGNPVIVMIILGVMGYKKRTSFLAGLTVAQISEFSLVLVALAVKEGIAEQAILGLTTVVGVLTMTISTYMIVHGNWLYNKLKNVLGIFEFGRGRGKDVRGNEEWKDHVILFGHSRTGSVLRPVMDKSGKKVVVVDFDPVVVGALKMAGVEAVYGDLADVEMYDGLGLKNARLIVSTVPDVADNLLLLEAVRKRKKGQIVVATATDKIDEKQLYEAGADYVLVPHNVGGEYLAHILETRFGI